MAVTSSRTSQLSQLAGAMPIANQQVSQGIQAGQRASLDSQIVKAARAGRPSGQGAIQEAAAVSQQSQGQVALQEQSKNQQAAQGLAQTKLQDDAAQKQKLLYDKRNALEQQERANIESLRALDESLSARLWDEQLQFSEDELGRKVFTERQLIDWAVSKNMKEEEFLDYEQLATNISKFEIQNLEAAYSTIQQELSQRQQRDDLLKDNALELELTQARDRIQRAIQEAQARDAERQSMWTVGGQILGTIAGAVVGVASAGTLAAPAIAAGAVIGGSLGTGIGGLVGASGKSATTGVNTGVSVSGDYSAGRY